MNNLKAMMVLRNVYELVCRELTGLYCVESEKLEFTDVVDLLADNECTPKADRQTADQTGDSREERLCPPRGAHTLPLQTAAGGVLRGSVSIFGDSTEENGRTSITGVGWQ